MSDGSGAAPAGFPRESLSGSAVEAAEALLGALLVRRTGPARVGRIVEVEAYLGPEDRASHARAGLTARTAPMFGPPGLAYVYLVYGMYDCLNVVTGPSGQAGAVLVRAVEPLEGVAAMREALAAHAAARRRRPVPAPAAARRHTADHLLAGGPGLVAAAFSIDRSMTGRDLCDPEAPLRLEVAPPGARPVRIVRTPRIGVAYAGEPWTTLPYRLVDASSASVRRRTS
ncbi:MAG: DNA-3-methyladenine glycosylase [Chloroflexota bacterium]